MFIGAYNWWFIHDRYRNNVNRSKKADTFEPKIKEIKQSNDCECHLISCNRIIVIITKYNFNKDCICRLLRKNEWSIESCDDSLALIHFWRQSLKETVFDSTLSSDNNLFIQAVSDAYKIIFGYCLSNINFLKQNKCTFRTQLWKQLNNHLESLHYELSLMHTSGLVLE